ncbi:DUF1328 family protein [Profundibacterium mesophilum]|uniref:UPF0391 membrane protein PMES_00326 n=1 Tax=Profundibacterium mesophilum KAUST100406-0324 TaxID=1037889 RepID=A0A921TGB0_9RHOB|nr:DUF1328 family protein [Profundibacterium mesophilum]KAF0677279.1 membrane protein [Profundibacterium mesophilum KAUST100406-0324]
MTKTAMLFLCAALLAGLMGFGGTAGTAALAQLMFFFFVALFVGTIVFGAAKKTN